MTQQLRDTFVAHEHLAPDADLALEGIQTRIRTRRRSRIAVSGAVVAVAGVVAGAAVLLGTRVDHNATGAGQSPDLVSIAAGWLPANARLDRTTNEFGYQTRVYVTPQDTSPIRSISIGLHPGDALPWDGTDQPSRDLTVGGHPASESIVEQLYMLAMRLTDHQIATVEIGTSGSSADPAMRDTAIRVLTSMRFDRHDPVGSQFTLTYVPNGLTVRGLDRCYNVDPGTTCGSTSTTTLAPPSAVGPQVRGSLGKASDIVTGGSTVPARPTQSSRSATVSASITPWRSMQKSWSQSPFTTEPGRPVDGHRTWVVTSPGQTALWIDNLRPGTSIVVDSGPGLTSLDEMYRVADGLHWTG